MHKWEEVYRSDSLSDGRVARRMRVPGGWIYESLVYYTEDFLKQQVSLGITFVPEPPKEKNDAEDATY